MTEKNIFVDKLFRFSIIFSVKTATLPPPPPPPPPKKKGTPPFARNPALQKEILSIGV